MSCEELYGELLQEIRAWREQLRALAATSGPRFASDLAGEQPSAAASLPTQAQGPAPKEATEKEESRSTLVHEFAERPCRGTVEITREGDITIRPDDDCQCKTLIEGLDEIPRRFLSKRTVFKDKNPCRTRTEKSTQPKEGEDREEGPQ